MALQSRTSETDLLYYYGDHEQACSSTHTPPEALHLISVLKGGKLFT